MTVTVDTLWNLFRSLCISLTSHWLWCIWNRKSTCSKLPRNLESYCSSRSIFCEDETRCTSVSVLFSFKKFLIESWISNRNLRCPTWRTLTSFRLKQDYWHRRYWPNSRVISLFWLCGLFLEIVSYQWRHYFETRKRTQKIHNLDGIYNS